MKNKQSQKSRRREPATKPSGVSSKKVTPGYVPPWKGQAAKCEEHFLAQLEELYRTTRDRRIAVLRSMGIEDPEAALHAAVESILRLNSWSPKDAAYLLRRFKDRTFNAMAYFYRRQHRVQYVPDEFWLGLPADDAPTSTHDLKVEIAYLFERLDDYNVQILRWFYFDNHSINQISALTSKSETAIKTDLFRTRWKALKILLEFRAKEDAACNRPDPLEG